tara:strand:- start:266 stop:460 length:195 start_codon:yes stop_codon:yes gene_type:complete
MFLDNCDTKKLQRQDVKYDVVTSTRELEQRLHLPDHASPACVLQPAFGHTPSKAGAVQDEDFVL